MSNCFYLSSTPLWWNILKSSRPICFAFEVVSIDKKSVFITPSKVLPPHPSLWNTWWRHQMETFSALLAICAGIHRGLVNSHHPHNSQWRGTSMFSLICAWIHGWVNNHKAGDLRHYCVHYDVSVMSHSKSWKMSTTAVFLWVPSMQTIFPHMPAWRREFLSTCFKASRCNVAIMETGDWYRLNE